MLLYQTFGRKQHGYLGQPHTFEAPNDKLAVMATLLLFQESAGCSLYGLRNIPFGCFRMQQDAIIMLPTPRGIDRDHIKYLNEGRKIGAYEHGKRRRRPIPPDYHHSAMRWLRDHCLPTPDAYNTPERGYRKWLIKNVEKLRSVFRSFVPGTFDERPYLRMMTRRQWAHYGLNEAKARGYTAYNFSENGMLFKEAESCRDRIAHHMQELHKLLPAPTKPKRRRKLKYRRTREDLHEEV